MTPKTLLVRFGPPPAATLGAEGGLDAAFTGHALLPLTAGEEAALFGSAAAPPAEPEAFDRLVRGLWRLLAAPKAAGGQGCGHMLVGVCAGFDRAPPPAGSCGSASGRPPPPPGFTPRAYAPLYAVARGAALPPGAAAPVPVDLALDYRGTKGPAEEPAARLLSRVRVFPEKAPGPL
jgi:hypothetical protein